MNERNVLKVLRQNILVQLGWEIDDVKVPDDDGAVVGAKILQRFQRRDRQSQARRAARLTAVEAAIITVKVGARCFIGDRALKELESKTQRLTNSSRCVLQE